MVFFIAFSGKLSTHSGALAAETHQRAQTSKQQPHGSRHWHNRGVSVTNCYSASRCQSHGAGPLGPGVPKKVLLHYA